MRYKYIILLLLLQFELSGCNQTNDRVRRFVDYYNSRMTFQTNDPAYQMQYSIIRSTDAEVVPAQISGGTLGIRITFVSRFTANSNYAQLYQKFIPMAFTSLVNHNKEVKKLLEKGVKFYFRFNSRNNHVIKEVVIDRSNMASYMIEKALIGQLAN